ncbi:hypothetical protein D3C73_1295980 [compost metagenome]
MFVGLGRDADGQVNHLAVAPIHTVGELHQPYAGGKYLVAGLRGAVGNGNALAKKRRALGLTCLQTGEIPVGHQAIGDQMAGQLLQRRRLVHSRLAHGNLLYR